MIEFIFTGAVATLCTWALLDLYFYSIWFEPIRTRAEHLAASQISWCKVLGFGLNCPYCLAHWLCGAIVAFIWTCPNSISENLKFFDLFFLVTVASRLSIMLRENVLPPITESNDFHFDSEEAIQHDSEKMTSNK